MKRLKYFIILLSFMFLIFSKNQCYASDMVYGTFFDFEYSLLNDDGSVPDDDGSTPKYTSNGNVVRDSSSSSDSKIMILHFPNDTSFTSYLFISRNSPISSDTELAHTNGDLDSSYFYLDYKICEFNGRESEFTNAKMSRFFPCWGSGGSYTIANTDIPIFDCSLSNAHANINNYILNNDPSGAENYDEFGVWDGGNENDDDSLEDAEFDDTIDLPQNARTYGSMHSLIQNRGKYGSFGDANTNGKGFLKSNRSVGVTWSLTQKCIDDSYSYDCQMCVKYWQGCNASNLKTSKWLNLGNNMPYETGSLVSLETGDPVKRTVKVPESVYISYDRVDELTPGQPEYMMPSPTGIPITPTLADFEKHDLVREVVVRIRNRKGSLCSNWVYLTFNVNNDSVSIDVSGSVIDENGNVVDDDYYKPDNDMDNTNHDTQYSDEYDPYKDPNYQLSENSNLTDLISLVKSGFGFTGSHGLLTMFSSWFSWLPSQFTTVILCGFALMILICIIKYIFDK